MNVPPDPWELAMVFIWQAQAPRDEVTALMRQVVESIRAIARDCVNIGVGQDIAGLADHIEKSLEGQAKLLEAVPPPGSDLH